MFEPRPGDFTARLPRRARPVAASGQRSHHGRRGAVLLAAMAVPTFATPGQWDAFATDNFTVGNASTAEVIVAPMPFEKPGYSFPGSAFYYLAVDEPYRQNRPASAEQNPPALIGPAAQAMQIDNNGIDRRRALQCLTAAIYYEAASEPDAGQRAVAQVVLNRVAHPSYPNTVCGVVYQGSERTTGCQFSFTCDGSLTRKPMRLFWQRAEDVARQALSGQVYAPVGLATHYHTIAVHPYWAPTLTPVGTIGAHRFYRFGGLAGKPGSFRFAYVGGEPVPAPHPRHSPAIGASTAEGPSTVIPPAETSTPETPSSGDSLPQAAAIRPEYQNSGRWIARPGI